MRRWQAGIVAACLMSVLPLSNYAEEKQTKVEELKILQDVMQPLGMPVVTSYHKMRESLFLNTKDLNSPPLEALGDFFLTPSRYLFAGKDVKLLGEKGKCEVHQSFRYRKLHWLKTALALVVLPVTEVLGVTLKSLAFLSPEVRQRHKQLKTALRTPLLTSHLEAYKQKGIPALLSEDKIPCQGYPRPSALTKKQKLEIEALKEITQLLDQHEILYWIDCGTCLGSYRYGGFIPWDRDIDIAILLPDHENVKRLLKTLDAEKYQIQDWSSYSKPNSFLKLYVKATKNFIDIYHYDFNPEEREIAFYYTYIDSPFPYSWKRDEMKCLKPVKYETVFPLKRAQFDGLTVWAPNDVVTFLQSKFGENLSPCYLWDEASACYKKDPNHPYWEE